jgi:signal transduction histidine kinase
VTEPRPVRFLNFSTGLAAVGTVAVGVVQGLPTATVSHALELVVAGVGTALSLSVGLAWAERGQGRPLALLVAGAALFAALGVWVSAGRAYIMLMPVVSCAVLYLSSRVAIAVALGFVAEFTAAAIARSADPWQRAGNSLAVAAAFGFVGVFTLFAKRERYARREVERLSGKVEELAIATERNRIARELHDSLGHVLTVANVQLEAMLASPEGREARLTTVQALLKTGLSDLRRTVSAWRDTPDAPARFPTALAELLAQSEAAGLRVELETRGQPRLLPADVGFTLYRGAQEALTNVHRHAQASLVRVRLEYGHAEVTLRIADDGIGRPDLVLGNGLHGLQERLAALAGSLRLDAVAPRGLVLTLMVPR